MCGMSKGLGQKIFKLKGNHKRENRVGHGHQEASLSRTSGRVLHSLSAQKLFQNVSNHSWGRGCSIRFGKSRAQCTYEVGYNRAVVAHSHNIMRSSNKRVLRFDIGSS